MGPALCAYGPIGPGEELGCAMIRSPSIRMETDTPWKTGEKAPPVFHSELLTRPVTRKMRIAGKQAIDIFNSDDNQCMAEIRAYIESGGNKNLVDERGG